MFEFNDSARALIDKSRVVSFDVFDTAITRACLLPTDVFTLVVERYNDCDGYLGFDFKAERIKAERSVWEKQAKDVVYTIEEIYQELGDKNDLSPELTRRLMILEQEVEKHISLVNPEVWRLYDYALKSGKEIWFVSDMFLPAKAISQLLINAGYSRFTGLMVSCDDKVSKVTGQIFDKLVHKTGVKPKEILHVGDNVLTDIQNAKTAGLRTCHLPSLFERGKDENQLSFLYQMPSSEYNLPASVSLAYGLILYNYFYGNHRSTVQKIGYRALGPLLVAFCGWLHEAATNSGVDHLYFLARDGKIMQKAYNQLFPKERPRTTYMYASRRVLSFPGIKDVEPNLSFLTQFAVDNQVGGMLRTFSLDPASLVKEIKRAGFKSENSWIRSKEDLHKLRRLLMALRPQLLAQARKERGILEEYLASIGFFDHQKVGVVDIGWYGNLQAGMENTFGQLVDIEGFYFGLRNEARFKLADFETRLRARALYAEYQGDEGIFNEVVYRCIELLELMFSGESGSIVGLSKTTQGFKPIEDDIDLGNTELIRDIQAGGMQFIDDWLFFSRPFTTLVIPKRIAMQPIRKIINDPSDESAALFGVTLHQPGLGKVYSVYYMGYPSLPLWLYLLMPWKLVKDYQKAYWKAGFKINLRLNNPVTWAVLTKLRSGLLSINRSLSKG